MREPHAPPDAPLQHALAVAAEIQPALRAQQRQDLVQAVRDRRRRLDPGEMAQVMQQRLGHLLNRTDHIDHLRGDGILRHLRELGLAGFLRHGQPALRLDRPHTLAAVRPRARQDDADGVVLLILGKRAQEQVEDGLAALDRPVEKEPPVGEGKVPIGRNDVDVVGLDQRLGGRFADRNRGARCQQRHHQAFVGRVEMGNDDERRTGIGRHRCEQLLQRFQTTG